MSTPRRILSRVYYIQERAARNDEGIDQLKEGFLEEERLIRLGVRALGGVLHRGDYSNWVCGYPIWEMIEDQRVRLVKKSEDLKRSITICDALCVQRIFTPN